MPALLGGSNEQRAWNDGNLVLSEAVGRMWRIAVAGSFLGAGVRASALTDLSGPSAAAPRRSSVTQAVSPEEAVYRRAAQHATPGHRRIEPFMSNIRPQMNALRFNVFGSIYLIQREDDVWQAYALGADGKRSPAGFVIPEFIEEREMEQFLFDLFHESATPGNGDVRRIQ